MAVQQHVFASSAQKDWYDYRGSSAPAGIGSRFKVGNGEEIDLGTTYEGIVLLSFVFQCSGYSTGDNLYGNIWNASGNSLINSPAVDGGVDTSSPFTEKTFQITDKYLPAGTYFAGFSRLSGDWMAWDAAEGAGYSAYTSSFGSAPDGLTTAYSHGSLVGYLNYTKYDKGNLSINAVQTGDKQVTLNFSGTNGSHGKLVDIDWGDGSTTSTTVQTDAAIPDKVHTYASAGSKTITVTFTYSATEVGIPTFTLTDTITVATVPGAPASISATSAVGRIDVAWTAPASNGGSAILGYQFSTDGGSTWASAGTSPLEVAGSAGVAITVLLRAYNAIGAGPSVSATATPFTGPGAPTITSVTPSLTSASVAFTAGSNGGTPITDYEYSIDAGASWHSLSGDVTSPVTIPGLSKFTSYTVRLRAVNAAGSGPYASASFKTYGGRVKYYTGSAWASRWFKEHNGSSFADDVAVKQYTGSAWNTTDV